MADTLFPELAKFMTAGYIKYIQQHGRVSQNVYGAWLGLSSANISRYMTGQLRPGPINQDKIALKLGPGIYDALGVPRRVPRQNVLANKLLELMPDLNYDEIKNLEDKLDELAERKKKNKTPLLQVE